MNKKHERWMQRCAERAKTINKLYTEGWTLAEIGKKYGVTRQRIHQIISKQRA
jgi:DNA-directed RNA polymerase sigma subunit (sigma70/sigma32)